MQNQTMDQATTSASAGGPIPVATIRLAAVGAQAVISNETRKLQDQLKAGLDSVVANVVPTTDKINGFFTKLADLGASVNQQFVDVSTQIQLWIQAFVAQITAVAAQVPELINQLCQFISSKLMELVQFVTNLFTAPAPVVALAP